MSQLIPLPLTVAFFSKIQIGFTFLVPAHLGSPGKKAVKRVCVCVSCFLQFVAVDKILTDTLRPAVHLRFLLYCPNTICKGHGIVNNTIETGTKIEVFQYPSADC